MTVRVKWFSLFLALTLLMFTSLVGRTHPAFANTRYTVQKGDTLSHIAEVYHTSVTARTADNRLWSSMIKIHQTLSIPTESKIQRSMPGHSPSRTPSTQTSKSTPTIHIVRRGDTLWQLAAYYRTSVESLRQTNHLHSNIIVPGQKLLLYRQNLSTVAKTPTKNQPQTPPRTATVMRVAGVPTQLIPVYRAAGGRYGIPWNVLAAIHRKETNFAMGPISSWAGAQGPMQFMPSTFRHYAVLAPGRRGTPNINNVYDAIYTCAHMLAANGYAKNPVRALYTYNYSASYVYSIQQIAATYAV